MLSVFHCVAIASARLTKGDRTTGRRKLGRRRDDLCAVGFRKRAASGKRHRTQHHYKED
jgi:hypothetical protein